jgi:hypothetical protein
MIAGGVGVSTGGRAELGASGLSIEPILSQIAYQVGRIAAFTIADPTYWIPLPTTSTKLGRYHTPPAVPTVPIVATAGPLPTELISVAFCATCGSLLSI